MASAGIDGVLGPGGREKCRARVEAEDEIVELGEAVIVRAYWV